MQWELMYIRYIFSRLWAGQKDRYMLYVMNTLISCQVHQLNIETVGENLKIVSKSTSLDTSLTYPIK